MTSQKPPRPTLLREAAMLAKGKKRIMQSGDWLTAEEVTKLAGLNPTGTHSLLDEWLRARKIFVLRHEDNDYFPTYGLDPSAGYSPQSGMAEVIAILAVKKDGWGMAFWFGSSNSYLGGRLPKDVLRDEPLRVLEAAKDEIYGLYF